MPFFRKKPVVIEAHRIGIDEWPEAAWDAVIRGDILLRCGFIEVLTLEGVMRGEHGDWLIRGVNGELYPCKPDIFAATYDYVGATAEQEVT